MKPESTTAPNSVAQMPATIARLRGWLGRMLRDGSSYEGGAFEPGRALGRELGR
jgi:hypothetical protein